MASNSSYDRDLFLSSNPSQSECVRRSTEPLIATCMRHAKDLLGVDLSTCKEWLPMVEVHYQRPPSTSSPDAMESTEVRPLHDCICEPQHICRQLRGRHQSGFTLKHLTEHCAAAVKLADVFLTGAGLRDLPGERAVSHARELAGPVEGAGGLAEEEGGS